MIDGAPTPSWLPDMPAGVAEQHRDSDWYRIGGAPTIKKGVDRMYGWAIEHDEVRPYFTDPDTGRLIDVVRIKRSFAGLITQLLGGPKSIAIEDTDALAAYLGQVHRHVRHAVTRQPITSRVYYLIGRMFMAWLLLTDLPSTTIDGLSEAYQALEPAIVPQSA